MRTNLTPGVLVLVILAGCAGGSPGTPSPDTATEAPAGTVSATPQPTAVAPNGSLEVHFINVGQSVSTLVISPSGETMLIDTGDFNTNGKYALQYLQRHDIDQIDHLVVTHNDADHIGGNAAIINYYETEADGIGAVYDPGIAASTQTYDEYLDAVEEHNVTLYETREGDSIPFAGVEVNVWGPPDPYLANEARNENSIVLKLVFGETSFLLPGDAEDDQEAYLVEQYGSQLQSTILKAGHHGSKSSSSGRFLDAVAPQAVVISSAYDSRYGHPNEETLQRLAERSIPAYWTGTHGDIVLVSNGTDVTIKTQQQAPTDASALREGDRIEPGSDMPVQVRARIRAATGETLTTATAVATDGGTATVTEDVPLTLATINADASGDDRDNLNDEYIILENTGDSPLDLSGWTVRDEAGATYTVPQDVVLDPGDRITLHTGSGTDTDTDLYWGSGSPIWNNGGDTIIITTAEDDVVLEETY